MPGEPIMIFVLFFMISLIEPEDVSAQEQEIISDDVNVLINKGAALNQLGQYAEAIEYYDKALAIGIALMKLSKHTEAIQIFDRALKIEPEHAGCLYNKGLALEKLGKDIESIQYKDRAQNIGPTYVDRP